MPKGEPYIPETITVHLGRPDADAMNVEVPLQITSKMLLPVKSIQHGQRQPCGQISMRLLPLP